MTHRTKEECDARHAMYVKIGMWVIAGFLGLLVLIFSAIGVGMWEMKSEISHTRGGVDQLLHFVHTKGKSMAEIRKIFDPSEVVYDVQDGVVVAINKKHKRIVIGRGYTALPNNNRCEAMLLATIDAIDAIDTIGNRGK